jgi:hypothetical protein
MHDASQSEKKLMCLDATQAISPSPIEHYGTAIYAAQSKSVHQRQGAMWFDGLALHPNAPHSIRRDFLMQDAGGYPSSTTEGFRRMPFRASGGKASQSINPRHRFKLVKLPTTLPLILANHFSRSSRIREGIVTL